MDDWMWIAIIIFFVCVIASDAFDRWCEHKEKMKNKD